MPLYEVVVERTFRTSVFVDAPDRTEARQGAEELADATNIVHWDEDFRPEVTVLEKYSLPGNVYEVWVGGETGRWVHGDEYDAGVRA